VAGFLSKYKGITRVEIEAPSSEHPEGYWADVKTHLTRGETKTANDALYRLVMKLEVNDKADEDAPAAEASGEMHLDDYQTAIAMAAVVTWNLTDEDDVVLPLEPTAAKLTSLDLLPGEVFNKILAVVQGVAKDKIKKGGAAEKKFPR
jgi:hypothetical protein